MSLDAFTFKTTAGSNIDILETYEDGSVKTGARLVLTPHIADLAAKLHIFVWGASFTDGTVDHTVSTNDFITGVPYSSQQSSYPYSLIVSRERQQVHGPYHTYKIYQNGVLIGE